MHKMSSISTEGSAKEERRSGSNRMEKLLGIASGSPPPGDAAGDLYELGEEDVWGGAEGGGRSCSGGGDDVVVQYKSSSVRAGLSLPEPNGSTVPGLRHKVTSTHQSAPVNVPDWSSMVGMGMHDRKNDIILFEDESMVPPHEYVARQQAMNATAMFAGFGRRLKARDLSRVRNAVWSRTGFLD